MRNGVIEAPRATSQPDPFHWWPCGSAAPSVAKLPLGADTVLRACEWRSRSRTSWYSAAAQRQQTARAAFQRELSRKAPAARGAAAESSSRRRRPTQYGTCYRIVSVWYGTPHDTVTCYTSAHNGARARPARPPARTHRRAELIERAHHAHVRHARNSNALRPFAEGHRQSLSSSRVFLGPFFSISPTVPSNDCTTIPCSPPCARMPSTDWLIPSSAPAWPEPDRRRSQPCA
jgi:hypothetical protein